ncbi:hypothetical protein HYQ44_013201 [Verticillium longisporum]|nr:hypothetical protein HYQ44_013201 [Verticillium longisporum]
MADDLEVLEALVADLPSGRYREFLDDVQNHPGNRLADQEPGTNAISPPSSSSYVPPTKTETLVKPSGWTSRYGVSRKTPNVGGGRSWIDPDFPRLSHDTFEPVNPPDPGDTIPEPHSEDLDRLFQTEEMQRLALGGMRTWEAALMVQEEENMPKETEPLASSGTLADSDMIDESKWFRVLGKNRWICDFEEFVDGGGENRKWSVDDALLWAELRQVLDITNRILKQAAHTRWMSTFLDMRTIRATKNVRLPKGGKKAIDHFCEDVNFTFNSVNRNSEAPNGCPYGVTGPLVIDGRQSILIQVDTMGALALIKPGVSETSKRHARALLAITITHEILFMFDELLSEMGESFENAVFGGVADLSAHPLDIYRFSGSTNGAALLASNIKWPVLKPSTWESYSIRIDLEYPDALRMPRVFATHVTTGFDVTCVPAAWNHDLKTNASLERPLKQMARRIQYRRKQYEEWRPWYKEAYDEWRNSPYGNVRNRYDLEKVLNKHLVGRTFADERDIADIISTWSNPLVWPNAGPEELPWLLDSHDMIDKSNWFYRAMCMLITAVLPIRFEPVHVNPRKGHMPELVKNPWTVRPSVLEGQPEEQRAFLNRVADSAYRESDPIENTADFVLNFPCHKLDWEQGKEPYSIKDPRSPRALRRHFLHEAAGYFKIYENVCAAPLGLKEAFEAALKDVAAQVGNLADPGVNREGTWLNLNFAMAGYTRASQKTCLYRTVEQYRPIWGRDADPDPVDTSLPTWAQMVDVIEPLEDRHRVMYQWTPADIVEQNSGNGREVCIIERRTVYLVYFWDAVKPPEKSPLREVAAHRYLNKECPLGAYIIIWNNVYDVTEWARLHPAGIQLIAPHVGKDVSDIFRKNHHYLAILSAIEHLRIGRIVPEHDPDKRVPPHTFTHHDTLISFQPDWIQDTPRGELYRSVWNDNSPWAIDDEGIFADKHLYSLEKRRVVETMRGSMELITHKIRRPPFEDVAQMLPAILEDFNGQRIDEWTLALAFVAVNEWVYDVTNVMRYGIEEEKAKLSPWVGRAIDDEEIRNWVIETFEFAVVAQLVNEITEDPDQCENWDPRIPDHKPDQIYKKLISLVASSGAKSKKRKREDEETTETTEDLIAPIKRPKPDSEGSDASDDSFARYFEPPADDPDSDVHLWGTAMMVRPSLTPGNGGGDGEPPDERPTERNDPWNREAKAPNRSSSYSPGRSGRRTASGRERGNGPRGSGSTRPHASSPGPSRSRTPDFDPLDIIDQRELQTSLRHKLSALAERSKVVKPARRRDARRAQAEASRSSPGSSRSNTTTPEKGRKSPSKARPDPATPTRSPARRTPAQQPVHREQPRENLPAARGGWLSKSEKRRRAIDEVLYREQAPAPRVVAGTARPMGPEEMSMMRRAVMQVDADRERMMQWKDTRETKQIRPSLDALTKLAVDREEERNIEMEEWKRAEAWLAEQVEKAKANLAKGPEIRTNPPTGQPAVPATSTSLPIVGGPRPAPTDALAQERLALQRLAQGSLAAAKLEQETEEYQRLCVVLNGSIPQLGAPFTFASKEERAREKASLTARLEEETPTRKQGPAKGPRTARDDPARAAARRALEQRAAAELSDFEARGLRGQLQPREMIPVLRERFRREILRRTPQYNIGLRGHMERVLSRVNLADYMPRVSTYVHNEEEEDIYGPS